MFVFTNICDTMFASSTFEIFSSDPALNPNQRMNMPNVASGMLQPGNACTEPSLPYLPLRAPTNETPVRAATAPFLHSLYWIDETSRYHRENKKCKQLHAFSHSPRNDRHRRRHKHNLEEKVRTLGIGMFARRFDNDCSAVFLTDQPAESR